MKRGRGLWVGALAAVAAVVAVAAAQGAAPGVQVSVLSSFAAGAGPSSAAATNQGDVVVPAGGGHVVRVAPDGGQTVEPVQLPLGAFFIGAIGMAYGAHHELYAAVPQAFGPPATGQPGIFHISANGKSATPVPGSEAMVAADGMGYDASSGYLYVTDIFGGAIWRVTPDGNSASMWTSDATNSLLGDPDGVKVYDGAVYASTGDRIVKIPIKADGSAGTATEWARVPGAFFDDMTLDDRTGDVYVSRLDTDQLLQITPTGHIAVIASNADDGLLLAANMALIHVGKSTVIYLANSGVPSDFSGHQTGLGPALLKITIG